jgi:hypothetical protein
VRKNKEEYEALASIINSTTHPISLSETQITKEQKEMQILKDNEGKNKVSLETREKQFQILLQSIFDLKSVLNEDEEDDSLAAAAALAQDNDEEDDEDDGDEDNEEEGEIEEKMDIM